MNTKVHPVTFRRVCHLSRAQTDLVDYNTRLGQCGNNGEGCTLVEVTLENGKSAADISLIPP